MPQNTLNNGSSEESPLRDLEHVVGPLANTISASRDSQLNITSVEQIDTTAEALFNARDYRQLIEYIISSPTPGAEALLNRLASIRGNTYNPGKDPNDDKSEYYLGIYPDLPAIVAVGIALMEGKQFPFKLSKTIALALMQIPKFTVEHAGPSSSHYESDASSYDEILMATVVMSHIDEFVTLDFAEIANNVPIENLVEGFAEKAYRNRAFVDVFRRSYDVLTPLQQLYPRVLDHLFPEGTTLENLASIVSYRYPYSANIQMLHAFHEAAPDVTYTEYLKVYNNDPQWGLRDVYKRKS